MVEVVAEDQVVAVYGALGREVEGDAVGVFVLGMCGEGEIGGGGGGGVGEALVILGVSGLVFCLLACWVVVGSRKEKEKGGCTYLYPDV